MNTIMWCVLCCALALACLGMRGDGFHRILELLCDHGLDERKDASPVRGYPISQAVKGVG